MRNLWITLCVVSLSSAAMAQTTNPSIDKIPGDSPHSTGRTHLPTQGQMQPQGPTGTTSGGAPAESPQGQTPPGMQAAPEGSSKTIVETK